MEKEVTFERVAYQGQYFIVEWYVDSNNRNHAFDYYSLLSVAERVKVLRLFKCIGDGGRILDKTKFRSKKRVLYTTK